jgi:hypothetical protein
MSFNRGAGPGVWVAVGATNAASRCALKSPRPLQVLRLLAEDAQLETKRSNEGGPSQSEWSEAQRARRAKDSGPPLPSGLRWGQHGGTSVSEWAQK